LIKRPILEIGFENKDLQERFENAESTLQAIKEDRVDAFIVTRAGINKVLTLKGTDYLYRVIVESMNEGAVTLIPDGTIFYTNQRFAEMVQKSVDELIGSSFHDLIVKSGEFNQDNKVRFIIQNGLRIESVLQTTKGDYVPVEMSVHSLGSEDILGFCIVVTDITERKNIQENLIYLSSHDSMTGLYNRNFFEVEMDRFEKGRQFPISVIEIDIDKLKQINDEFGHSAGDDLIKRVAEILKETFREDDIIARIGGDEFAVLLPNVDLLIANKLANRIKKNLIKQNSNQQGLPLRFSLGVASAETNDMLTAVLKRADREMYSNKQNDKGISHDK
jgi:diguanylate cyclase (GGDEF)-like protein/PAS domain S-box-containing protein